MLLLSLLQLPFTACPHPGRFVFFFISLLSLSMSHSLTYKCTRICRVGTIPPSAFASCMHIRIVAPPNNLLPTACRGSGPRNRLTRTVIGLQLLDPLEPPSQTARMFSLSVEGMATRRLEGVAAGSMLVALPSGCCPIRCRSTWFSSRSLRARASACLYLFSA